MTPSPRPSRRYLVLPAVLATLAMLAGCGGGTGMDEDGTTSVTIGKAVDTIGFTAVDIAVEQGFFADQGIDVETTLLGGSAVTNSALQSGDIQFAAAASLPLLLAREKGLPLISVASMDYGVPMQLIVGGPRRNQVSDGQSLEERMKVLAGAKVGHVSATDGGFVDLLLERAGVSRNAVKKVSFQSAAAAVTAVERGAVDAAIGSPPTTLAPVERDKATVVANAREVPEYEEMAYDILTTTEDFAEENREVVKGVATALAKAGNFIEANPEKALEFEKEHFSGYSEEVLAQSLELVVFARNGQQTDERWANAVETYRAGGLIKKSTSANGCWTNSYIDVKRLGRT